MSQWMRDGNLFFRVCPYKNKIKGKSANIFQNIVRNFFFYSFCHLTKKNFLKCKTLHCADFIQVATRNYL